GPVDSHQNGHGHRSGVGQPHPRQAIRPGFSRRAAEVSGGSGLAVMEIHEILKIAGGALALILFVPLVVGGFKDGGAGQSFATWLLWAALDTTTAVSIMQQGGNYHIALGFAIGGVVMTLALLCKGRFGWGRFETTILLLVIACMVAWKLGG